MPTEDSLNGGLRNFELALDTIGENALLYSGIAYTYLWLMEVGTNVEENRSKAEEYVKKALSLDPNMAKAQALLGWLNMWWRGDLKDLKEAAVNLKKALAMDPNESLALSGMIVVYAFVSKISSAIPLLERLKRIDPLDFWTLWTPGCLHFLSGEFDLAVEEWRKFYQLNPKNMAALYWLAIALTYNGQTDEAFSLIDRMVQIYPGQMRTKLILMLKHGLQGDKQAALSELTGDFREVCKERIFSWSIAVSLSLLDKREEAVNWLENSVNHGYLAFPLFSKFDPFLENIRGESRFKKLMERLKHEWESFEI
jgi:tetratricopeptide (TPR) repeat protein